MPLKAALDSDSDGPAPLAASDVIIVEAAARLSVVEIGLGAVVHGLKIPAGGHALSLNQGFFLTRVVRLLRFEAGAYRASFSVSMISAILKSLSPAGNKLGPMISIGMQGALFSGPVALLGVNLIAVCLGMVLLSLWAFLQPFVTLYLFFGNSLWQAIEFYQQKMQESFGVGRELILQVILFAVIVKAAMALAVGILGFKLSSRRLEAWDASILKSSAKFSPMTGGNSMSMSGGVAVEATVRQRLRLVLRDLSRPLFLASFVLLGAFFYFSEGSVSRAIWLTLRPLAIAILFFYFSRSAWLGRLAPKLRQTRIFAKSMALFDATLSRLRSPQF